jgi:myo-inositol-1(or 4)-monophosphatase
VVDLDALHHLAAVVAEEAGTFLLDKLGGARVEVDTKSSPTDMVTEMDRAAEGRITTLISAERPDDGLLGEEGATGAGTSGIRWVIDPLDGTTNYLYRLPAFAVSIAAEDDQGSLVAAVYDPSHAEVFSAIRGVGAWCNGRPLLVAGTNSLEQALVATGFSYQPGERKRQAQALVEILPAVRDIRRVGAAAIDLCWVAAGRVDAYFERGLQPWDLAAGELIAREAGAWVGGFDGGPPRAGNVVAAAPHLREPLLALLDRAGA